MTVHHSIKNWVSNLLEVLGEKLSKITASDKINALTLSPLSGLVSWLNCTKAPRNFFTLVNALFESCKIDGVADCCVDADEVGGGVVEPSLIGKQLQKCYLK